MMPTKAQIDAKIQAALKPYAFFKNQVRASFSKLLCIGWCCRQPRDKGRAPLLFALCLRALIVASSPACRCAGYAAHEEGPAEEDNHELWRLPVRLRT